MYVSIHSQSRYAVAHGQDDVGAFVAHAGQGCQLLLGVGHAAAVTLFHDMGGGDDVTGLVLIEAAGGDHGLQLLRGKGAQGTGVRIIPEQGFRDAVHLIVVGLSGQDHGHQQLPHRTEAQCRTGAAVFLFEQGDDLLFLFFRQFSHTKILPQRRPICK